MAQTTKRTEGDDRSTIIPQRVVARQKNTARTLPVFTLAIEEPRA